MRRFQWSALVGVLMFLIAACSAPPPAPPAAPPFKPTATVKDIMDSVVDPAADAIWESVATIVSAAGTEERRPKTDEEWKALQHSAVRLVEASNLLMIEGRRAAQPGHKSEFPGIELEPEEVEKLINDDRQSWVKLAAGLHDASLPALKAVLAKDPQGLLDAGEGIDQACESCHLKYWYPLDKQAQKAAEGAGSVRKQ